MALQTAPVTQLSPIFRGPNLDLCRFPRCQFRLIELPLAQVSCFCGYPHYGVDVFAHIITPSSLQLDSGNSAQCLAVDVCICFHQLLDEGFMMTARVFMGGLTLSEEWIGGVGKEMGLRGNCV